MLPKKFESETDGSNTLHFYNKIAVAVRFLNINQCWEDLEKAILKKADLVEIRFDYSELLKEKAAELAGISSINHFKDNTKKIELQLTQYAEKIYPKKGIKELRKLIKIPVIFTLRSKEQGGDIQIPEIVRIHFIRYLMQFGPDFFDLEASIEYDLILQLTKYAKKQNISIIYSNHDWMGTPSEVLIRKMADELLDKFPNLISTKESNRNIKKTKKVDKLHSKFNILKLIFTAKKIRDNETALNVCKFYAKKGIKIVCFCMGELGMSSRVGSLLSGAYFSFASIDKTTAPGQIHIDKFREMLDLNIKR